ncbi:hypothetical protein BLA24_19835 [Streptomyces cinnamoneus]|uniref:DUF397 domain-containing protein n=1 Tax=Streptomyces cinnamoneus TaxID=53446 RepID=A0A2G1XFI0_STRCJ|nr:DUF397 domain-containing protein [Streptomyces cinnamoneus]PHQ49889.1 hypothetical protein BLA24_19835 [Streptomyces cinnamoneus]PPT13335.1 DUF397 domain-containing protein [Streptomyces cinnamoneus]
MLHNRLSAHRWRKSSYSGDQNPSCLEWQHTPDGSIAIRDSKTPSRGGFLFRREAWSAFVIALQSESAEASKLRSEQEARR